MKLMKKLIVILVSYFMALGLVRAAEKPSEHSSGDIENLAETLGVMVFRNEAFG